MEYYIKSNGEVYYGDRFMECDIPVPPPPSEYHDWNFDEGCWVVSSASLKRVKVKYQQLIDVSAGIARTRYITTVPGQDATYQAKLTEALAYIAAGYPEEDLTNYPYIASESYPNNWMNATQAATRIATLGTYWRDVVGPKIESLRVNGKDAIEDLTDIDLIIETANAVIAQLTNV